MICLGLDRNPWLCGALYTCKECHQLKLDAQAELQVLMDGNSDDIIIEEAKKRVTEVKYAFRSYNPLCLSKWMEKYPHVALSCEVHVTHRYVRFSSAVLSA